MICIYIYTHIIYLSLYIHIYIYIYINIYKACSPTDSGDICAGPPGGSQRRGFMRCLQNTVGNLIEICWPKKAYHRPQLTGICMNNRGVRFHRVRDFKQYCFNSIPPTSQFIRGNCLSSATCLTQVFFKSDYYYSKLW